MGERVLPGSAIAFDADGTLWSGDIGVDTFEAMLERRAMRKEATLALLREARAHGIDAPEDPTEAARALYRAFAQGAYPESDAFQMMAWAFAGYREDEASSFAIDVIEQVGLRARLHPEVLPILRWAEARAVPVFVVSASAGLVVRAAIERLALPVTKVFAMTAAVEDGVVAPRIAGAVTYGPGKIEALRGGGHARLLAAFGDSAYDLAMLAEAEIGVAVRPKPALRAGAQACPDLVELEPA
jgi:HAD superfamily phosphoserine phosphatase-like hydrolase